MFPEYQDYLKTLPPNPPYSQVQAEQQKQIEEQSRHQPGKGSARGDAESAKHAASTLIVDVGFVCSLRNRRNP